VAALAAQLEASKIIFRPMLPTARAPRANRDQEEGEEDGEGTYERHLGRRNPFVPTALAGRRIKRKEEVPPKPPRKAYVQAKHDFAGLEKGDLSFKRGDRIEVLVRGASDMDWWTGRLEGRIGLFPANYTKSL
jgi:amphiphysin